ncbi:MAG: N-acetylmuramoyl-L-alanine amidase-like domain-containing protein [Thermodesulfovibrionales bacterium]
MELIDINSLIRQSSQTPDHGERIAFISRWFLNRPYKANTLIGGIDRAELLVANLEELDCFTFLDYVEALRLSSAPEDFTGNLKRVRYKGGEVSFVARNHFFTDWIGQERGLVKDLTELVGGGAAVKEMKRLNQKADGSLFIPGILTRDREICYIPSDALEQGVLGRLSTGDYAGIYTPSEGLDVSHVGIIVREGSGIIFRHASRDKGRVVDDDLCSYMKEKPGLLILRPITPRSPSAPQHSS